jgi:peroxiredoxin
MKGDRRKVIAGVCLLAALFLGSRVMRGIRGVGFSGDPAKPSADVRPLPVFELPVPEGTADRTYLGISGTGTFKVADISARVLIIEVLDFDCPYCRNAAPMIEEVYRQIEGREDLRDRIKIIGIASGNSPYEVGLFKEKYHVSFPLFADGERRAARSFHVLGTPTFIAARIKKKGTAERFYLYLGSFEHPSQFLADIVKRSGMDRGPPLSSVPPHPKCFS